MTERHPLSETSADEFYSITTKETFASLSLQGGRHDRAAKTFGLEHAPLSRRANAVAPGPVDTAFLRGGTGRSNEDA
jgi:hypothetical protein